jgi:glycine oxidase
LELLRAAYEALPGITELELTEARAGLRPGTPDNRPIVGPGAFDGLVWASGHYRNGILLAGVTADAVAELVATGELQQRFAPFSPRRFGRAVEAAAAPGGAQGR